jgi:hypothetical protein
MEHRSAAGGELTDQGGFAHPTPAPYLAHRATRPSPPRFERGQLGRAIDEHATDLELT